MLLATVAHFNQTLTLWCEFVYVWCLVDFTVEHFYTSQMKKIVSDNSCQIFVTVARPLFTICHLKKVVEEEEVVGKNPLSLPIRTKQQCAIWDNTTLVEISALHNKFTALKCTVFKYTNTMRFGTHSKTKLTFYRPLYLPYLHWRQLIYSSCLH